MQKLTRIGFPSQFFSHKDDQYASVDGTFVILDDKIYHPINHVKVACYKDQKYCRIN